MTKYGNKPDILDSYRFDSLAELSRYKELKLLLSAGEITDLWIHPRFELQPKFRRDGKTERAIVYEADFSYRENGQLIVEDVKGKRTQLYSTKRKMLLYKYPEIEFREVKA